MKATKSIYRVIRSLIFTTLLVTIGLIALTYILLAIPAVQTGIRERAEKELSEFLGGKVEISDVEIKPFNEVRLYGVSVYDPTGDRCLSVGSIGAGVRLWSLVFSGKLEFSYAEIISLNLKIIQAEKDGRLNIDFIIRALFPEKKDKKETKFDLTLRNVVVRKSVISFDRLYEPAASTQNKVDFNHIEITNFRADMILPTVRNNDFTIDLQRVAFEEKSGLKVNNISLHTHITPEIITAKNIRIKLEESKIALSDIELKINGFGDIQNALLHSSHDYSLTAKPLVLSELSAFLPVLSSFDEKLSLDAEFKGKIDNLNISHFLLSDAEGTYLNFDGVVKNADKIEKLYADINDLKLIASKPVISKVTERVPNIPQSLKSLMENAGQIELEAKGSIDLTNHLSKAYLSLVSDLGDIIADADLKWNPNKNLNTRFSIAGKNINLQSITNYKPLGLLSLDAEGDLTISGKNVDGDIVSKIHSIDFNSICFENIILEGHKSGADIEGKINIADKAVSMDAEAACVLAGVSSSWVVKADVRNLLIDAITGKSSNSVKKISGKLYADIAGDSPDNMNGLINISDLCLTGAKSVNLNSINIAADLTEEYRRYELKSDLVDGVLEGNFSPLSLFASVRNQLSEAIPIFIKPTENENKIEESANLHLLIKPAEKLFSALKMSVRPGVPIEVTGAWNSLEDKTTLAIDAPYLIKGKNKLIKNTAIDISLAKSFPADLKFKSVFPLKLAEAQLSGKITVSDNSAGVNFNWEMIDNPENNGEIRLFTKFGRNKLTDKLNIFAELKESTFNLNDTEWLISHSIIDYSDRHLAVDGLNISNGFQYVSINGQASDGPIESLNVDLSGIDLKYIFDILNINHVDFGGIASGKAHVSNLFSNEPIATTDRLFVKNLSYNDCVLGDGELEGKWDNEKKAVVINADINGEDDSRAIVHGDVYVIRDSLSFDFDAHKVNAAFLRPFVSGFTSDIRGKASGQVHMYGTFADVDLAGKAYADSVSILVDYTNVYYSGSDSVFFSPGKIEIPYMRLTDCYGNACDLSGKVTHNFLRDAGFDFDVRNVDKMLVFDTSPAINPIWYGKIFANGSASIRGIPGLISVNVNMSTADNSSFTFVIDENETAVNYTFLTFTDRRKEALEMMNVQETFEDRFRKQFHDEILERPDVFSFDLTMDVTPGATLTIVMDPKAGDKIVANGKGPLQVHYDTETDKFNMYGKYTLDNGVYNFSLQDIILKNFNIREGSAISFNGDPLRGILDITAVYRVNANLADLDDSFRSDPDLKRTSIPVDALLKVSGEIEAPEINFDLELPTVTADVSRRVRSIVSTEDMMNQQMIYLLALNRFYSPEYTASQQGGEFASVASSTISSQIQNIIGSLTDKFSLAPSFKTDKDNFSDMEVDVALSSNLFDNRLLINGNLGYRDKSTSQTTFIGDFDIEYLLTKDGKLRLKAYNHFNDASYYLKSSLTTQGLGIIYRKDFNDPFSFLKRLFRRKKESDQSEPAKQTDK